MQNNLTKFSYKEFISNTWNIYTVMMIDFIIVSFNFLILRLKNDPLLISAFGFSLSYLYFSMCFLYGFSEFLGIYLSKSLGKRKFKDSTILIFKTFLVQGIASLISFTLAMFCPYVMNVFGINEDIKNVSILFVRVNIFERIFDAYDVLIRTIIVSINESSCFNRISFQCLFIHIFIESFLYYFFDMVLSAYSIARLSKTLIEIYILIRVIIKKYPKKGRFIPKFSQCLENISIVLVNSLQSSIGIYGELMSFEICTFFVSGFQNLIITSSWVIFQNIMQYLLLFGIAQAQSVREYINRVRSKITYKEMQQLESNIFLNCYLTNFTIGLIIAIFRKQIAGFYTKIVGVQNQVCYLLLPFSLYLLVMMNRNVIGTILRSKQNRFFLITFIVGGLIFPLLTFSFNYIMIKVLNKGLIYILAVFICVDTSIYIYYFWQNSIIENSDEETMTYVESQIEQQLSMSHVDDEEMLQLIYKSDLLQLIRTLIFSSNPLKIFFFNIAQQNVIKNFQKIIKFLKQRKFSQSKKIYKL